jgi:starch synthase
LLDGADQPLKSAARVFTIHNLGFPGPFDAAFASAYGLPARSLRSPVEAVSVLSGTGQGILWSDMINTVSPTYSREILTEEYGAGLDPLLRLREDRLVGILNGIDYEEFNPSTDQRIAATFDAFTLEKRASNKEGLQRHMGLPTGTDLPLMGVVSRLFWQKGIDLAYEALSPLLQAERLQVVILGTGDEDHESLLRELQARHPRRWRYHSPSTPCWPSSFTPERICS